MTQPRKYQAETKLLKDKVPLPKNSAPKEERIQSAIAKGKQTLLPCEKGQHLSKFEHNGRDGPIMVYAEEAQHKYNKFGHYKVIMALKPAESVRNQLFFGNDSSKHNKEVLMTNESSHVPAKHVSSSKGTRSIGRFVDRNGVTRREKKAAKPVSNPDSFEELIERYKTRRVMYNDLMGTGHGHVEVMDKLDSLYSQRKQERLKLLTQFSNLGEIRTEINTSTGLRDHAIDLEEASKEPKEPLKLPKIRVSTVSELTQKDSRRKLDRKRLVVPKEKTGALRLGAQKVDLDGVAKLNEPYDQFTITLPEL